MKEEQTKKPNLLVGIIKLVAMGYVIYLGITLYFL